MKRQTDLLTFFKKAGIDETRNRPTSPPDHQSITSLDASYLIPGTPCPSLSPCGTHSARSYQFDGTLSSKPMALPILPKCDLHTSTLRRKPPIRRRSSLVVRRQAELADKYATALITDSLTDPVASSRTRTTDQARTAAKLRRGNFDGLNYAPIDQVQPEVSSSEPYGCSNFKRRSRLLISNALSTSLTTCALETASLVQSLKRARSTPIHPEFIGSAGRMQKVETDNQRLEFFSCEPQMTPSTTTSSSCFKRKKSISFEDNRFCRTFVSKTGELPNPPDLSVDHLDFSTWCAISDSINENPIVSDPCTKTSTELPLPNRPFYRGVVKSIHYQHDRVVLQAVLTPNVAEELHTHSTESELVTVELTDSWTEVDLQIGDTIHIVPGFGSSLCGRHIVIGDGDSRRNSCHIPACLIVHPDTLITGTKLVGSFYCERRSLIEQFWLGDEENPDEPEQADNQSNSTIVTSTSAHAMLTGSLVHELFQKLIFVDHPTIQHGQRIVETILRRPNTLLQLYSCGYSWTEACSTLSDAIRKCLSWIEHNRKVGTVSSVVSKHPLVREVIDIEENIWSSRFGIKGKIDLSAVVSLPSSQTNASSGCGVNSLVPVELKTGRPTYSSGHKGQVLLYILMLLDRYGPTYTWKTGLEIPTAVFGWLVYLEQLQSNPSAMPFNEDLIAPCTGSFRSLLQTRNRLASHIHQLLCSVYDEVHSPDSWMLLLPSPIKNLRTCQTCPVQLTCSLLANPTAVSHHISNTDPTHPHVVEFLATKRIHLTMAYVEFFRKWSNLVLSENLASDRIEDVISLVVAGRSEQCCPTSGVLRRLKVLESRLLSDDEVETILRPSNLNSVDSPDSMTVFSPDDWVIVSSDDGQCVGYTLGTVASAGENCSVESSPSDYKPHDIFIRTTRPLPSWIELFRLDRYISSKVTQTNLSNLVGLMQCSPLCAHLRSVIIDGSQPTFTTTLSKQTVTKIRGVLKHLNTCQRAAILRVLMANHYVLIKGYPGTGKTETLASLIRVFILLGKKVLVVSHTHSAVDNLLVRLIQYGERCVLRLGSLDRVHPVLKEFTLEQLLSCPDNPSTKTDLVEVLQTFVEKATVVACTALAAGGGASRHPALSRIRFDLVIVDEASQLLLPTTIGSLLRLRWASEASACGRFVLVGDPHQLPPLVRDRKARQAGLDCSLFTHLLRFSQLHESDQSGATGHVIQLDVQYRMNENILRLSNELFYSNSLKAADEIVASGTIADLLMNSPVTVLKDQKSPIWILRALSPLIEDSALFVDTRQLSVCTGLRSRIYCNDLEAKMIDIIVRFSITCGFLPSDVGVITPYRNQVDLVRRLLGKRRVFLGREFCNDTSSVEVNTVDQYQGRDKRMIVLSLTICSGKVNSQVNSQERFIQQRSAALLGDAARLTVAITRAKHKLIIIGCSGFHETLVDSDQDGDHRTTKGVLNRLYEIMNQSSSIITLDQRDLTFINHMSQV